MARRWKQKISEEDLAPKIAAGLTQGMTAEEAAREFPNQVPQRVSRTHMKEETSVAGTRVPLPRFVAEEDADSIWLDEPTGRFQKNVTMTFQPETIRAIKSGMLCLRCLEPQEEAFPVVCTSPEEMGCFYPIKDRQIMDFAMEFEGEKHLGPSKPIAEYLEEQELRVEKKRRFIKKRIGAR